MKDFTQIIEKPIITEKGTMLRQDGNQLVFAVHKDANKIEIKQAIEDLFSVHVEDVKTMVVKGKTKRWGMHQYKRRAWKKAIVTLRQGESIEFYEGV
ncbi:MAG TPA: 50S ribosomal protein L23 [Deltaproteobacteria bacterium]|nr:50S ribosomal protein L23 [Deltaproteobacteria bacterium]HPJ95169.1 50S ribosomal protein L23 [Deltaproteobacteria bacterium]HPR53026.1 50S ribosomal protein L23 [Deltaproteobacteria bacterium]